MRSLSRAIWTSGDPVSPSCVLNCSIRLRFFSTFNGIWWASVQSPRPEDGTRRDGFKKPYVTSRYLTECTTPSAGRLEEASRLGRVRRDLLPERLDRGKLHLGPEPMDEGQTDATSVEIAFEIQ